MRRRFTYALTASVLSSGAPAGLLGIRLAKAPDSEGPIRKVCRELVTDRAAYVYVGGATAIIFALFGYVLGRQADALAELSETDSLTGLLNARGFSARFAGELRRVRRYREPFALLFLDLDGLKDVNDRHGHRAGSDALREAAGVIRSALRETDTAARWGGDEFTVLAPSTTHDAARLFAERVRARIAEDMARWPITASIGVATLSGLEDEAGATSASRLMKAADAAMYEAKRRGKNTVVLADAHLRPAEQKKPRRASVLQMS